MRSYLAMAAVAFASALIWISASPSLAADQLTGDQLRAGVEALEGETHAIKSASTMAHDIKRQKYFPIFITYPVMKGKLPIIIFSHGLAGSGYDYGYLAQYWAQHGFICVQPFHEDSLEWNGRRNTTIKCVGRIAIMPSDKPSWIERAGDISFIIGSLPKLFPNLAANFDMTKIGVGGHSYGSFTSMLLAGASVPRKDLEPRCDSVRDKRIAAIVALSPQSSRPRENNLAFDGKPLNIAIPALYVTGDRDEIAGTGVVERAQTFQLTAPGDKYYVSLLGANHMTFVGGQMHSAPSDPIAELALQQVNQLVSEPYGDQKALHKLIQETTLLFWDAYLKGDTKAKAMIHQGALASIVGTAGETRVK